MHNTQEGHRRNRRDTLRRQEQKGYQFSSLSVSSLVTLMSSAGIKPSQKHLREIDICIYVHFLVAIFLFAVKRYIRNFEFKIEVDKTCRAYLF
jgi:hypothetical protein